MLIYIDSRSSIPIYDQIVTQIKDQIISGTLKQDDMLPSIRNLAKELRISVITTKRAYEELEREGFVYTIPSKGCFVAPKNIEMLREQNLKEIERHLQEAVRLSARLCLTADDLLSMLKNEMEESE